jgi:hypothetical protein
MLINKTIQKKDTRITLQSSQIDNHRDDQQNKHQMLIKKQGKGTLKHCGWEGK